MSKEKQKLSLFADDLIAYLINSRRINDTPKLIKNSVTCKDIKLTYKIAFIYTNSKWDTMVDKTPFTIAAKKINYIGINLTRNV